jgi:hypothetical protein
MSYDYLSANRALLSRYTPDEIIYFNLNKRFVKRLQAGQTVSMMDYPFQIISSAVPIVIGTIFVGPIGFLIGGGITVFALWKLANTADRLDKLWRQGVLIEAEDIHVDEETFYEDNSTEYIVHYVFYTPHQETIRGKKQIRRMGGRARALLMLYRDRSDYLIL